MGRFAHITVQKTGSQWVKDVLTDPGVFAPQDLRFVQPRTKFTAGSFAAQADRTLVAPMYRVAVEDWRAFTNPDDRCIVVLRDPRDVIVSWAFSVAYSHVTERLIALVRPALLALDLKGKLEVGLFAHFQSREDDIQRSWVECEPTEREAVYRYEDLLEDEYAGFRSMVDHFGWPVAPAELRDAIERLSFTQRSGGRARGDKDSFSHYRNAVPGDWKNYFDREFAERFERASPGLVRALGYEESDDWWREQPQRLEALTERGSGRDDDVEGMRRELDVLRSKLRAAEQAAGELRERIGALTELEHELDAVMRRLALDGAR